VPDVEPAPLGSEKHALLLCVSPETAEEYARMKREYQQYCRSVGQRHRGAARQAMLRVRGKAVQRFVRQLLESIR
jgi:hypothetical protein